MTSEREVDLAALTDVNTPWAIRAAVTLGIPDVIGDEPSTRDEIAQELAVDSAAVGRLLRYLSCRGVFVELEPGVFAHNDVSRQLCAGHSSQWDKWLRLGGIAARLDRAATEPLHQQLYRQIRDEIASGSFNHNSSRLPSSRALAADFGVSRFTVNLALSRLHAEGYLQSRIGSGTFISEALPETFLSARTTTAASPTERPSRLSKRVKEIPDHRAGKQFDFGIAGPPGVSFVPAVAALDEFPIAIWERLRTQVLAQKGAHLLQYASSRGDPELRKALATYLCDYRGARCDPDQIIITAGTQQAMMISAISGNSRICGPSPSFSCARPQAAVIQPAWRPITSRMKTRVEVRAMEATS